MDVNITLSDVDLATIVEALDEVTNRHVSGLGFSVEPSVVLKSLPGASTRGAPSRRAEAWGPFSTGEPGAGGFGRSLRSILSR